MSTFPCFLNKGIALSFCYWLLPACSPAPRRKRRYYRRTKRVRFSTQSPRFLFILTKKYSPKQRDWPAWDWGESESEGLVKLRHLKGKPGFGSSLLFFWLPQLVRCGVTLKRKKAWGERICFLLSHYSGKKYWYILCLFWFSSSFSSLRN